MYHFFTKSKVCQFYVEIDIFQLVFGQKLFARFLTSFLENLDLFVEIFVLFFGFTAIGFIRTYTSWLIFMCWLFLNALIGTSIRWSWKKSTRKLNFICCILVVKINIRLLLIDFLLILAFAQELVIGLLRKVDHDISEFDIAMNHIFQIHVVNGSHQLGDDSLHHGWRQRLFVLHELPEVAKVAVVNKHKVSYFCFNHFSDSHNVFAFNSVLIHDFAVY